MLSYGVGTVSSPLLGWAAFGAESGALLVSSFFALFSVPGGFIPRISSGWI